VHAVREWRRPAYRGPAVRPWAARTGAVLALAGLAGLLWLSLDRPPVDASVADIMATTRRWEGVRVRVRGRLVSFQEPGRPPYGVIEDGQGNRIGIRPLNAFVSLLGRRVVAVGTVRFDRGSGFYLAGASVRPDAGRSP
jgi:hypothetical protein